MYKDEIKLYATKEKELETSAPLKSVRIFEVSRRTEKICSHANFSEKPPCWREKVCKE